MAALTPSAASRRPQVRITEGDLVLDIVYVAVVVALVALIGLVARGVERL